MKKLNQLIDCEYDIDILGITTDSRKVKPGYLFVATKGYHVDHYDFIDDAICRGAVAVVVDCEGEFSIPTIVVSDIEDELISICEAFYDVSSRDFIFIGITGTDGKTTTATITRNLLNEFIPTAYIGTNGLYCGEDVYSTTNTTPCVEELYHYFSVVKQHKCKVIVMEVSSEALLHRRVHSILFQVIAYTNITEDHLNIHKTLENYRNCKFELANLQTPTAKVFINGDDQNCQLLDVNSKISFGFSDDNDCVICDVKECQDNVAFSLLYNNQTYRVQSPFFGRYNIYNVTLALLIANSFSIPMNMLLSSLVHFSSVPGRREVFSTTKGFDILLDYAHTEYGILNLLKSLNHYSRVIVVTGAAGGREIEKRSRIGDILFEYADYIVFTMDDPRYEDPKTIALQMIGNHDEKPYTFVLNREDAIYSAFENAREGEVVAVIGKGRDTYMAIEDRREMYSDYEVIKNYLKKN